MSTRGYLTIVDEQKNIQAAAFYPNSAYPSYLGLQVLDAIEKCEFPQFVNQTLKENSYDDEMIDCIDRSWYVKTAANKDAFFYDYAYELNGTKQELTLFHFGNKALTIPYDQIPLFRFIFENENKLYYSLCLDERSMMLKKDFYKEIRTMVKNGAGVNEFQVVIDKNPSVLYLDTYRLKDLWDFNSDSFNKEVRDSAGDDLKFHIGDCFGQFHIYVQTPFIRSPIPHKPIKSAAAAEKFLAEIIRDRPDDIRATMNIFKELESYSKKIHEIYADDGVPLNDRADWAQEIKLETIAHLKEVQSGHRILGDTDRLLEREIGDVCSRNYRLARERMEKQEQKAPLFDMIQDAAQRAEARSNGIPSPVLSGPDR